MSQATHKARSGLSTCEKEDMKATKSSTIGDLKYDHTSSSLLSSSYRKERETTEAIDICKNMKTYKVESVSSSHIGHQTFVSQLERMSRKKKCKELISLSLPNGSTGVPSMPDMKETVAVENH